MRIVIIAITKKGITVASRIKKALCDEVTVYLPEKIGSTELGAVFYTQRLRDLVGKIFPEYKGIVLIMAMGIVMRVIAPYIKDKHNDPAVVVVDDVGRSVISCLSGHEGGANQLAHTIANILHTDAIITTGTEAQKDIIIGVGCKRGVKSNDVKEAVRDAVRTANISIDRVRIAGTVDLKANEPGLLRALEELCIPLRIVSRSEIDTCAKDYVRSDFVQKKIGIGGVCEPAALLSGRKTKLILKKQKYPGVTVAVAQENFMW
ncbi:MAG: cobalamin biosynthesis protein [Candidatus Scalindua sp.]|nr:cobalamin biosynthesis protein [Candidatus Scalindua sp.]